MIQEGPDERGYGRWPSRVGSMETALLALTLTERSFGASFGAPAGISYVTRYWCVCLK
jgi:hypothetical protein